MSHPTYYETPHHTPPIYPGGANSVEARVKAIEVHLWHQSRLNETQEGNVGQAHNRISALEDSLDMLVRKIGLWLIGALGSATLALLVIVLKVLFPGIFR